jgi:hypothetical protein
MTAVALDAPAAGRSELSRRIGSVVRLHFTNPGTLVVIPLIVLAGIWLINLSIWLIIWLSVPAPDFADAQDGFGYTGSSLYIFAYMVFVGIQAMNGTFRFAQGFGATRRDYYLGTALVFLILTAGYSALMLLMGVVEEATRGWGLGGHMFTPVYFGTDWGQRIAVVVCLFLFVFFVGAAVATVYVRWRRTGMLVFWGAVVLLVVLAAFVVALLDAWPAVGAWLDANLPAGLALWSLVPTAVFGVVGFFILRRATPAG